MPYCMLWICHLLEARLVRSDWPARHAPQNKLLHTYWLTKRQGTLFSGSIYRNINSSYYDCFRFSFNRNKPQNNILGVRIIVCCDRIYIITSLHDIIIALRTINDQHVMSFTVSVGCNWLSLPFKLAAGILWHSWIILLHKAHRIVITSSVESLEKSTSDTPGCSWHICYSSLLSVISNTGRFHKQTYRDIQQLRMHTRSYPWANRLQCYIGSLALIDSILGIVNNFRPYPLCIIAWIIHGVNCQTKLSINNMLMMQRYMRAHKFPQSKTNDHIGVKSSTPNDAYVLTIISPHKDLSFVGRQATTWASANLLLIVPMINNSVTF